MKGIITGYLGGDAENKLAGQHGYTEFSIADTVGYGTKATTQWVRCKMWGERGEKLSQYLKKGTPVVVFGEISLHEWVDKSDNKKANLECRVDDVKLMGGKKDAAGSNKSATAAAPRAGGTQAPLNVPIDDDDVPF